MLYPTELRSHALTAPGPDYIVPICDLGSDELFYTSVTRLDSLLRLGPELP